MAIRHCTVIAVDGTHASGKTTLIHALTAHYRRLGVNVAAMGEPARTSPYMEDIVLHKVGEFDIAAEMDVFAAHLQAQLRAARNHDLLIADKTILNVWVYAAMLVDGERDPHTGTVLDAMLAMCRAWMHTYDVVLFTQDYYNQPSDGFRNKVTDLQHLADTMLSNQYEELDIVLNRVPRELDTAARVEWATRRVAELGLEPPH